MKQIIIILIIYIIAFIINAMNGNEWYWGFFGGLIITLIYCGIVLFYEGLKKIIRDDERTKL